ncbi:MAG TPA: PqiC family protein [Candidatus Sulfotelmatobacter sp.]|nr:PqiC family protein [Candidatus Sulfotelmatobacter sp.]
MNVRHFQFRTNVLLMSLLWAVLLTAINGCSLFMPVKDEEHDYLLTAEPSLEPTAEAKPARIVRVLPVEVPEYLQTSDLVIRTGTNEVVFAKSHQWAEPLDAGIRRALVQDLRGVRGIQEVLTDEPPPAYGKPYIIFIHVLACEANDTNGEGTVLFSAAWEISQGWPKATTLARGVFQAPPSSWHPGDFAGMVSQISDAVAGLGGVLAQAISGQADGRPAR